jgi:hypothetical protein
MIASPCRNCKRTEKKIPKCFDECEFLKTLQEKNFSFRDVGKETNTVYTPSDTLRILM